MYETKDFNMAVTFKTLGIPLSSIRSEGKIKFFLFDFSNWKYTPEEVESMFWNGELRVDAKTFMDNRHELMSRVKG